MASNAQTLVVATATGVLCHHLIFIQGEWHVRASSTFIVHVFAYAALTLWEAYHHNLAVLAALDASSKFYGIYLASLFSSITIYRLFLHRLRQFPGPVLAGISKFWHFFHCLDSKNHILLHRLHERYGSFVRTGKLDVPSFLHK